ncbi:MauE/DoxX family redox-associated membrane protein [Flavihumibacter sp. UBA7668]|uniref:MauE/DoxX family redox-associated membrane protein n=1 Tax=Flavihumibacter sp. UBA7668 TaxID=1946542 RepID=UPI0025C58D91|nr:MauE/DoxX family redox-associated membrane protein [Flavihumibacter sp. UBA7668]
MKKGIILEISGALLVLLFVYTALSKLLHQEVFIAAMEQAVWLRPYAKTIAFLLPLSELLIAGLLLIPAIKRSGFWLSFVFLVTVTVYLGWMLLFSPDLPCNCGGVLENLSWRQHVVFNLFFIGLSIIGIRLQS